MCMNRADNFFFLMCYILQMGQINFKNQWSKLEQCCQQNLDPSWPKWYTRVLLFLNVLPLLEIQMDTNSIDTNRFLKAKISVLCLMD